MTNTSYAIHYQEGGAGSAAAPRFFQFNFFIDNIFYIIYSEHNFLSHILPRWSPCLYPSNSTPSFSLSSENKQANNSNNNNNRIKEKTKKKHKKHTYTHTPHKNTKPVRLKKSAQTKQYEMKKIYKSTIEFVVC